MSPGQGTRISTGTTRDSGLGLKLASVSLTLGITCLISYCITSTEVLTVFSETGRSKDMSPVYRSFAPAVIGISQDEQDSINCRGACNLTDTEQKLIMSVPTTNTLSALQARPPIPSFSKKSNNATQTDHTCWKQVQLWSRERHRESGQRPCPGLPCGIRYVISTNYATLQKSDAVVLQPRTGWNWAELLSRKPPGQKWIMQSHESQMVTRGNAVPPLEHFNDSYDYSMTFRFRESQLYGGFGRFDIGNAKVPQNDTRNWAEGRTRQVAWISSNCDMNLRKWNRTGFVHELAKLVDVGMYGKCGNQTACPNRARSGANTLKCHHVLKPFKFYLSFENSVCHDYISEKFWRNALFQDLVPIVFGAPRSDYEAVAPPNSFIHVQDFKNIRELAAYIRVLDKCDHLYNKYFEWKKIGRVRWTTESWLLNPQQMCQVVERLLVDEQRAKEGAVIKPLQLNYTSWWRGACSIPRFPIPID